MIYDNSRQNGSPYVSVNTLIHRRQNNGASDATLQTKSKISEDEIAAPVQSRENHSGMTDSLRSGLEGWAGMDISEARTRYQSNTVGETPEMEERPIQGKFAPVQRMANIRRGVTEKPLQRKENSTGMPDSLKTGMESLSGMDMSDVRVHYNSPKPMDVGALAYTQGTDIHVGPGQEKHLPHEAWHVVQQAQGQVRPTMQLKGVLVNDDAGLEREADDIGRELNQESPIIRSIQLFTPLGSNINFGKPNIIQRVEGKFKLDKKKETCKNGEINYMIVREIEGGYIVQQDKKGKQIVLRKIGDSYYDEKSNDFKSRMNHAASSVPSSSIISSASAGTLSYSPSISSFLRKDEEKEVEELKQKQGEDEEKEEAEEEKREGKVKEKRKREDKEKGRAEKQERRRRGKRRKKGGEEQKEAKQKHEVDEEGVDKKEKDESLLKIKDRFQPLGKGSKKALKRRAARMTMIYRKREGKYSARNKFAATILANGLKVTFMFRSAGMGGEHPKYQGRSASHTEPIWEALWTAHKEFLMKIINEKLVGKSKSTITNTSEIKLISLVSTNSPCQSNQRDVKEGCGGILSRNMGATDDTEMVYIRFYKKGAPTVLRSLDAAEAEEEKADDSTDEELDEEKVRGKDLEDEDSVENMDAKH
ncbi:MAG TPA: DUF4157 domain-containing protein [Bacillota bacterium]|nr:DUF4157 domain-containing protein [Bacillota bacterium]